MIKILLIDDNEEILKGFGTIISCAFPGSAIDTALKGLMEVQLAIEKNPDVIFINAFLPGMDALELCRQLKKDQKVNHIPVVFLISNEDKEWKIKALDAGAEGFLCWPADPVDLIAQVKAMSKIKNSRPAAIENTIMANQPLPGEDEALPGKTFPLNEELLRMVADAAYDWEFLIDQNRQFIYCSPSCERITGYRSEEFMADSDLLNRIVHPDDQPIYKRHLQEVHHLFQPGMVNFRIIRLDGSERWIGHVCQPIMDQAGALLAIRASNRDITDQKLFEGLLKSSEDKYRGIFENVQDVYYEATLDGILLEISPSVEMITRGKYKREDIIGQTLKDLFIDIKERDLLRNTLFEKGSISDFEISVRFKNEEIIPCSVSAKIWLDQYGKPQKIIGSIRDITSRKQTEEALRQSEESYRAMFDNNPQPMFIYDLETLRFVKVNNAAMHFYGYTEEEFLSMTVFDIRPAEDFFKFARHHSKKNPRYNLSGEWQHRKKNGETVTVNIVSHALIFDNRPARHVLINDVTERNRAKQLLLKSEEKFRAIFENNSAVKLLINPVNGRIVDANIAAANYYGWSCEELKEMNIQQINTLSAEYTLAEMQKIKTADQYRFEFRHLHKDGSVTDVEVFSSKVKIEDMEYLHSIIHDISNRKQAENDLRVSEERFRRVVECSPNGIVIYQEGKFVYVNPAGLKLFGANDSQDLIGKEVSSLAHAESAERIATAMKMVAQGQTIDPVEEKLVRMDGFPFYAELAVFTTTNNNRPAGQMIIRNITDRKLAEESIQKLSLAINQSQEIIFITNTEGIITFINSQFTKVYGYTPEEIIGKQTPRILKSDLISLKQYTRLWDSLLKKKRKYAEYINRCKDGRLIDIEGSADPILDENGEITGFLGIQRDISERKRAGKEIAHSHELMRYVIEHNRSCVAIHDKDLRYIYVSQRYLDDYHIKEDIIGKHHYEVFPDLPQKWRDVHQKALAGEVCSANDDPYIHEDGTIDWTQWECRPWYSADGSIGGIVVYTEIINDRKKAEADLIAAKEKAEESDRLKSAFLANMSHEIRTPLNSIVGFSELLRDSFFDEKQKTDFIDLIVRNGHYLLGIINDILDISKIQAGELKIKIKKLPVNDFIAEIIQEYAMKFKDKEVDFQFIPPETGEEAFVMCDSERLSQVLNNLLSNAGKFTRQGSVKVSYQIIDRVAQFEVKDTGIGIAPEYHEKIFERFRQVEGADSRKYGGNGLGLAISKKLVELMGGTMRVESQQGIGSSFYFTLPLAEDS